MDTPTLLAGAGGLLLGAWKAFLSDRSARVGLATLQGAGMMLLGAAVMIAAVMGPLPQHPTVAFVAVMVVLGVGLILTVTGLILSRLDRSRRFRYRAGSIPRQKGTRHG
jgi:hypothetical protein